MQVLDSGFGLLIIRAPRPRELRELDLHAELGETNEGYKMLIRACTLPGSDDVAEAIIEDGHLVPNIGGAIEDLVRPKGR